MPNKTLSEAILETLTKDLCEMYFLRQGHFLANHIITYINNVSMY